MAEKTLSDLFEDSLKDIYFAERKFVAALPKMAKAASSPDLSAAFRSHLAQTEEHVSRLERIFEIIGEKPKGKTCPAIEGILKEGSELLEDYAGSPAVDAALISAAQAVEHYEITRYGTMKRWAEMLGFDDAAELLAVTLAEEAQTDEDLTELAENGANEMAQQAAE